MSDPETIVYVVDDDASVRMSLERLLDSVGLRAELFTSAREFLDYKRLDCPACLILDVRLPGLSGIDLQKEMAASNIRVPIIFISGHGDIPMSVRAIKAGAVDFLPKPYNDQDLLDAIHKALDQDRQERRERAEVSEIQRRFDSLTPRERDVLTLIVAGWLNKQIAYEFGVSESMIKAHRAHVMEKMQAESLADLVRLSEKLGIRPSKK